MEWPKSRFRTAAFALFALAIAFPLLVSTPGEGATLSLGGMAAFDTVKVQLYSGFYVRLLAGERLFSPVSEPQMGRWRVVVGVELNWLWPLVEPVSGSFSQLFPYLLGGLRQERGFWEVYGGISPVLTIQQGTLLYYPWVFYAKGGVQLTLRPLVIFAQLTELLVIGQAEETGQQRTGLEVGFGFGF